MGWFDKPAPKPKRGAAPKRCQLCRKARCECRTNKVTPIKEKVKVEGRDGRTRTVTRNSNVGVDARGMQWCQTCSCRINNGTCSNVTCSTRRA